MPKIDYSKCDYIEATRRVGEYNSTHDIATEEIIPLASQFQDFIADPQSIVFASSMPRALITAKELF